TPQHLMLQPRVRIELPNRTIPPTPAPRAADSDDGGRVVAFAPPGPANLATEGESPFRRMWAAYPRRGDGDRGSKTDARKAFTARVQAGADREALVAAAQNYATYAAARWPDERDPERRYLKKVAAWLNGEVWREYLTAPSPPPAARRDGRYNVGL